MHWYWQNVGKDSYRLFFVIFQRSFGPWLMSEFCFHLISWEKIDGFWWNSVYAVLWLAHEIFLNFSIELWPLIGVKISIFRNNEWILLKFCLCIDICSMLWLIHIIFPNFSTELLPLIDFRIMFMLNILWNNWWIWSNLVVIFDFFYAKTWATTKISTLAGYHVVPITLLLSGCMIMLTYYVAPTEGEGGHIAFGADLVSVALCLHSIFWTIAWILNNFHRYIIEREERSD